MTGRRLRYLGAGLGLAAAGAYLFIYLHRWEWHRAVLAAVFVVVAEVGLLGAMILDRLHQLERRMDAGAARDDQTTKVPERLRDAAPEPAAPFAWLEPDRMSVFVPVLLGAGVVLSIVAWVVERLARVTAGATIERALQRGLRPLALPRGVLVSGWEAPMPRKAAGTRRLMPVLAAGALAVCVGLGVDALADATQNRGDRIKPGTAATVIVQVSTVRRGLSDEAAVGHLWGACAQQLGAHYRLRGTATLGAGRVALTVTPNIGTYAARRFRGCVQDATADLVLARIERITPVP